MTQTHLPLMRPRLPEPARLAPRLASMHASGMYSNRGPQVRELEERMAGFLGTSPDRVVSVANATLGLMGALCLSPEQTWAVPSWTFSATVAAALQAGRRLTLVDARSEDWWIDPPATRDGILAVAPFGSGVDPTRIDPGRETVIDAAASLGARIGPLSGLPPRAAVVFSIGATKVLGSGEGGIVVFGDPDRAQRFASWTLLGFHGERTSAFLGINARMPEITAVVAHAALDDWERERDEWRAARRLAAAVETELGIEPAPLRGADAHPYWIVRLPDQATRHAAERSLAAAGIDSRRWWADGCHRQPAYATLPRLALPVTEGLAATTLGLPFSRSLTADETSRIHDALDQAMAT